VPSLLSDCAIAQAKRGHHEKKRRSEPPLRIGSRSLGVQVFRVVDFSPLTPIAADTRLGPGPLEQTQARTNCVNRAAGEAASTIMAQAGGSYNNPLKKFK
jgi:hypothetical protein